jgi:hypothetical protein
VGRLIASGATCAAYTYLGTDTIIKTAHRPFGMAGLDLTVGNAQNGYSGLDQWGRVVDQVWASDAGAIVDDYKYG